MYDRFVSLFQHAINGEVFSMLFLIAWGLVMGLLSYKLAGAFGFNEKWKKITALAGFLSLGGAILVMIGRWAYKAFFVKEDS
jgi:hypothetical protein